MFLVGDVGGTKTHLALFDAQLKCVREEKYASAEFSNLSEIVKKFTHDKITAAAFGLPGPVRNRRCHTTNLPWIVDEEELVREVKAVKVFLLNDLEAHAWGIQCLKPEELVVLQKGVPEKGNLALIAAGTGLGEAGLYWDGKDHHPFASEGGHTDFAPRSELEMELLRYLRKNYGHVSYERILSGPGLYGLYRFLIDMQLEKDEEQIRVAFAAEDPGRVITEYAINGKSKACIRTVEWFISLYGSEAGNLALKYFAVGGVYIGGGIGPKTLPFLQKKEFLEGFVSKGRFRDFLSSIPIYLILNENTAILGAAKYCASH